MSLRAKSDLAKQSYLDCFVVTLLAMTLFQIASLRSQ